MPKKSTELFPPQEKSPEELHEKNVEKGLLNAPDLCTQQLAKFFHEIFPKDSTFEMKEALRDALLEFFGDSTDTQALQRVKVLIESDSAWDGLGFSRETLIESFELLPHFIKIFERFISWKEDESPKSFLLATPLERRAFYAKTQLDFFFHDLMTKEYYALWKEIAALPDFPHRKYLSEIHDCSENEVTITQEELLRSGGKVHFGDIVLKPVLRTTESNPITEQLKEVEDVELERPDTALNRLFIEGRMPKHFYGNFNIDFPQDNGDYQRFIFEHDLFSKTTIHGEFSINAHQESLTHLYYRPETLTLHFSGGTLSCEKFFPAVKNLITDGTIRFFALHPSAQNIFISPGTLWCRIHQTRYPQDTYQLLSLPKKGVGYLCIRKNPVQKIKRIPEDLETLDIDVASIDETLLEKHKHLRTLNLFIKEGVAVPPLPPFLTYLEIHGGTRISSPLTLPETLKTFRGSHLESCGNLSLPPGIESLFLSISSAKGVVFPPNLKNIHLPNLHTLEGLRIPPHAVVMVPRELQEDLIRDEENLKHDWVSHYANTRFNQIFPENPGEQPSYIPLQEHQKLEKPTEEPGFFGRITGKIKKMFS